MKKVLALLLAVLSVLMMFTGCKKKEKSMLDEILKSGKITMATSPDFAPYEFIDPTKSGQESYAGADVALGYYIAEKLGVELVIEAMDFGAVQTAVSTGAVNMAISGFAYTEERAESMGLSDYYNITDEGYQGVMVLTENYDKYKTAEDFAGKKIAVQTASLQYNLTTEQLPKDIVIEPVANLNDAILMLQTGKVDAIAMASTTGEMYSQNYNEVCMSQYFFDYTGVGTVLAVPKGQDELLEAINEILAEVNELDLYPEWEEAATTLAKSLGLEV